MDSGADANLMDSELARKLNVSLSHLDSPIPATALDGRLIHLVTHRTSPVTLTFPDAHQENLSFYVFNTPHHPLILGLLRLKQHAPHIDWSSGEILAWGPQCSLSCRSGTQVSSLTMKEQQGTATEFSEEYQNLSSVPSCYLDLKQVFSKTKATTLPPHRSYDCAIDLLPGTTSPRGQLYSLSGPGGHGEIHR